MAILFFPGDPVVSTGCRAPQRLNFDSGNLSEGPLRFTELKRAVDGVSQRMLTVTLRSLERDGILTRTVHEVMPPRVTYQLATLGQSLLNAALPLLEWGRSHADDIAIARVQHDRALDLPEVDTAPRHIEVRQHFEAAGHAPQWRFGLRT